MNTINLLHITWSSFDTVLYILLHSFIPSFYLKEALPSQYHMSQPTPIRCGLDFLHQVGIVSRIAGWLHKVSGNRILQKVGQYFHIFFSSLQIFQELHTFLLYRFSSKE